MRGRAVVKVFAATVWAAVLFFMLAGNALAAFPGANGKILFSSFKFDLRSNWDVFSVNPNGSDRVNLTNNPAAVDIEGAWSPDGQKIAFVRDPFEDGIYVMNADGSGLTKVADDGLKPAWSPDGTKIAFWAQAPPRGFAEIYVIDADGSGLTNVSNDPSASDIQPAWSPDGTRIAFAKGIDIGPRLNYGIYVMNADGAGQTQLSSVFSDQEPDWSPDGQKLAFTVVVPDEEEGDTRAIYTMNADGSGQQQLMSFDYENSTPHWSPDGRRVVFASGTGISTMNPDGTGRADIVVRGSEEGLLADDWGRVPTPGPQRGDYKNTAQFCKAEREFMGGTAFEQAYGSNGIGRCVTTRQ